MVGTPCWAGLDDRQPPALLAGRQHVHPAALQHSVFGVIVDVAVEGDRIGDAEQLGVVDEALRPPAAADDVQVQVRDPRAQLRRPRRARPRSACAAPAGTAPRPAASPTAARSGCPRAPRRRRCGRRRCGRGRRRGGEVACRRQRHRDVLVAPVHARRQPRLDEPARCGSSRRPATGHCSRWQWCTSTTTRRPYTSRARNGTPFWVSMTTSGRTCRSGPSPIRAATIASPAQTYTV